MRYNEYYLPHTDGRSARIVIIFTGKTVYTSENIKKCHYFNNKKKCPFEDLGCMFAHRDSEICKFDQMCSKNLCSYKHSNNNPIPSSSSHEKDTTNEIENSDKDSKFECAYCTFKTDEYNPFMDHINTNHLESDDENENDQNDVVKDI